MNNTLNERIKERRLLLGYNQPELAKIMNVSKQTVSNWENGNRTPDAETLSKLSDLFSVSVDYLLGKTDIVASPTVDGLDLELTKKDEKDIEKTLNKTLEMLEKQEGLMLSGELIDEDDFELIKAAIQNGLEYAKKVNKKKFTPKKFKK
ncbi:helix-turn-helix domain-containing protein [Clostridium chromiireducens]|uniref:Helix-turn-helix domain-containing protein n=1 Tax=Clostridium chromiireducens TaxID=225345 RepID=A0A964W345_9CLOT|nr:helix-turn-helix domain-containing protein [Clostridium chromiireducens]MVX64990.1 helix-turn-helix domain-containing protein [Clostridium chromiireducens]